MNLSVCFVLPLTSNFCTTEAAAASPDPTEQWKRFGGAFLPRADKVHAR